MNLGRRTRRRETGSKRGAIRESLMDGRGIEGRINSIVIENTVEIVIGTGIDIT